MDTPGKGVPSELSVTVPLTVCPMALPPIDVSNAKKAISNRFFINGYFGVKIKLLHLLSIKNIFTPMAKTLKEQLFQFRELNQLSSAQSLHKWFQTMINGIINLNFVEM
jgi:hypothetical protein